jgi:hypothetical protein
MLTASLAELTVSARLDHAAQSCDDQIGHPPVESDGTREWSRADAVVLLRRGVAFRLTRALVSSSLSAAVSSSDAERLFAHEPAPARASTTARSSRRSSRPCRPELRVRPRGSFDHVIGPRPAHGRDDRGLVLGRGRSPIPTVWRARSSKRKKSWKGRPDRARARPPRIWPRGRTNRRDAACGRLVHLCQQLHGVDFPAPFC